MKATELCFPLARLVSEGLKESMLWNMQLLVAKWNFYSLPEYPGKMVINLSSCDVLFPHLYNISIKSFNASR